MRPVPPDEYHREVDGRRAYPEAFVDALTWAGWLSALIPQEYGGSGLGLVEASSATRWASMSVDTVWTLADADVVPRLLSRDRRRTGVLDRCDAAAGFARLANPMPA